METFAWNSDFEVGIEEIDRQHRELFRLMDNLTLSLYRGDAKKIVAQVLFALEKYVTEHFRLEEDYMYRHYYPDLGKHKSQHVQFIKTFESLKKDFEKHGTDSFLAIRVEKELQEWWKNHIMKIDRDYIPYLLVDKLPGADTREKS
jgi:hemerythrin